MIQNECTIPPVGWWCSRDAGHEGPCAARPDDDKKLLDHEVMVISLGIMLAALRVLIWLYP